MLSQRPVLIGGRNSVNEFFSTVEEGFGIAGETDDKVVQALGGQPTRDQRVAYTVQHLRKNLDTMDDDSFWQAMVYLAAMDAAEVEEFWNEMEARSPAPQPPTPGTVPPPAVHLRRIFGSLDAFFSLEGDWARRLPRHSRLWHS